MTKPEVLHFLKKIKAYYQHFSIEDYVVNEWYDKLKKYDINDVYRKLDQHLEGECKNEIPKIYFITKYLKQECQRSNYNIRVICEYCRESMKLTDYDRHVHRHNCIESLKKKRFFLNVEIDEKKLMLIDQSDFDKYYDVCLKSVVDKIEPGVSKSAILKYLEGIKNEKNRL